MNNPVSARARTYIIGLALTLLVCVIVAYSELVASRNTVNLIYLGALQMPPAAIGVLIGLVVANLFVRRLGPTLALRPAELAIIYMMTVCGSLLSSFGLSSQLVPNLAFGNYYATPANQVQPGLLSHFPKWFVPYNPAGPEKQFVTKAYFEGLRPGETIPWGNWVVPLIAWTIFALLLFFLMSCLATLLRRQWVDNEKLSFPLVQLPMEMMEGTSFGSSGKKLLWLGVAVPFIFHSLNGIHNISPTVPEMPSWLMLNSFFTTKPWTDIGAVPIAITFSVVGFAYLLPLDVSFSMWFFLLFFRFQDLIGSFLGYQFDGIGILPVNYYIGYQGAGAAVAVCFSLIWLARPHLKMVWQRVWKGMHKHLDADEMMSYRTAMIGAFVSFALVVMWCVMAGMNVFVATFFMLCFILLVIVVMSRCVAEIGLLMMQGVFRPIDIWAIGAPKLSLGVANLAPMAILSAVFMRDPRTMMPVFLDGLKLSDGVKLRKSNLGLGFALAIPVACVAAYVIHLQLAYHQGALQLNGWFTQANPFIHLNEAGSILTSPPVRDVRAPAFFAVGLLFTFFLYFMRSRFWWWPFHPLGYAIGASWPAMVYWLPMFIGWLIKSVIIRYGGGKVFRNFRPFFLGLILGEFAVAILWASISARFGCLLPTIPITP